MAMAQEARELPPMVQRASGSLEILTLHSDSTRGMTSVSTQSAYLLDMVSYSRPRWLPWASLPPLGMEMQIMEGTFLAAMRLSRATKGWVSPSAVMRTGDAV